MPAQQQHYVTTAYWTGTTGTVAAGTVLCFTNAATDRFTVATTANLATYGQNPSCIALTAGDDSSIAVEAQQVGFVPASITGLGAGSATTICVNSSGFLARGSSPVIVGQCDAEGNAHVNFAGIGAGGTAPTTPGGSVGDVQTKASASTFGAIAAAAAGNQLIVNSSGAWVSGRWIAGACTLEQFGAVGDGVTNDTTAFDAAQTALAAGTFSVLVLGAKTYLVNPTGLFPFGASVVGFGFASVLKTTGSRAIFLAYDSDAADRAKSSLFTNFRMVGSSSGPLGAGVTVFQNGIEVGYLGNDGAARIFISDVQAYRLYTGFSHTFSDELSVGANVVNCQAEECYNGFVFSAADFKNCQAMRCVRGANLGGNSTFNGSIESCTTGVEIAAGGNDGHGVFTGRLVHNTMPIKSAGALTNGYLFDGIELFEGEISIANGNTGAIIFLGGQIDATTYTLNGKSRWNGVTFDDAYFASLSTTNGENEFIECRKRDMTIPSWLQPLLRVAYTFPGDANQTLASQDSWAQTLAIQAGVVTATRTITLGTRPPNKGQRILVKNGTAQSVSVKWATGTAVTITTGLSAIVGADGTNATLELTEANTGGGLTTAGNTGNIQIKNGAALGALTPGTIGAPVVQSTTDGYAVTTISLSAAAAVTTPGSNGQAFYRSSGVVGAMGNVTYDGTNLEVAAASSIEFGTTPATAGYLRFPLATQSVIKGRTSGPTDRDIIATNSGTDTLTFGARTGWTTQLYGSTLAEIWANTLTIYSGAGGNNTLTADGSTIQSGLPLLGWSSPYAGDGFVDVSSAAPHTLSAGEYSRKVIAISGTGASGGTMTFPNPADDDHAYFKWIYGVGTTSAVTISVGAGTTAAMNGTTTPTYTGCFLFRNNSVKRIVP